MLKRVLWVVVALIGGLVAVWAYFGGFDPVKVSQGRFDATTVVYATHRGPYEKIGDTWGDFQAALANAGLSTCDAVAFYLDPPDTEKSQLRSILACRIDPADAGLRGRLAGFAITTVPEATTWKAAFPFRGFPSYFIAPMKVYPALQRQAAQGAPIPVLAIEDYGDQSTATKIVFHLPHSVDREAYAPFFAAF